MLRVSLLEWVKKRSENTTFDVLCFLFGNTWQELQILFFFFVVLVCIHVLVVCKCACHGDCSRWCWDSRGIGAFWCLLYLCWYWFSCSWHRYSLCDSAITRPGKGDWCFFQKIWINEYKNLVEAGQLLWWSLACLCEVQVFQFSSDLCLSLYTLELILNIIVKGPV